ncbi:hypothetical protein HMPREF9372_0920 [Sporosarcina newyorkensis 2681]|uniref:Homing endonuclease LAGLIDADG domain-containing protein n=1 Tax=Sporosarcina newyorkensis 2681 TaxID=1027292 RepID=F9DQ40_9BACL|nr:hypothetical protein HMPREF9372_0920 [Sporosarcina newyorkensis 2681]
MITELYQTWYPAGKKEAPFQFLNRYSNEEALSWWYQDDGHLKSRERKPVSKRTTIYLPSTFSLLKPTVEINEKLNKLNTLICHEGKIVCHASLFKLFTKKCSVVSEMSAYQIRIQDVQREKLASIRQQTRITVSQAG